jgi:hypothetical protein
MALGGVVLALAGGGGAAVAATTQGGKDTREAFLDSVAKHLNVTPQALRDAAKAAALEQVDAALAAGRITKAQADEMKARIEAGDVPFLGGGRGGPHGPGDRVRGLRGPDGKLAAAARYLGLTADQLATRLRDGQTLAQVAKARSKSVDGLEQAIVADVKAKLDQAVTDKRLTDAERTEMLTRLKDRIDELVNGTFPERWGPGHRHRGGGLFGP